MGVDVPNRGGECGFKSIAPALLGGEPQGRWSSGQVTRAGLWGGCCSAGVCFSSAMARAAGLDYLGGSPAAEDLELESFGYRLAIPRRRIGSSRGGGGAIAAAESEYGSLAPSS